MGGSPGLSHYFKNCNFKQFVGRGIEVRSSHVSLIGCIFDSSSSAAEEFVLLDGASAITLQLCWFSATTAVDYFIVAQGTYRDVVIDSCRFVRTSGTSTKAILINGFGRAVAVINPEIYLGGAPTEDDQIVVAESTQAGTHNEVIVIGGTLLHSGGVPGTPRVKDDAHVSQLVNAMWRMRLPRLTVQEIVGGGGAPPLSDLQEGDLVFDRDGNRALVYTSSGWREILMGSVLGP